MSTRFPLLTLCLAISSCLLVGCAAPHLDVADSAKSRAVYQHGTPELESKGKNKVEVVVSVPPVDVLAGEPGCVVVSVLNFSRNTFNFDTENVRVLHGQKDLKVYTYDELRKREEFRAGMQALAVGMNAASQSLAASTPATTTYSGNYYGSAQPAYSSRYRPVNYSGSYYGGSTTYNPAQTAAANAAINANSSAQISNIVANKSARIDFFGNIIRRTTIKPGTAYTAFAMFKMPSMYSSTKDMEFVVDVMGEKHVFPLTVKR